MGRAPCCDKTKVKRGPWSAEEDTTLRTYVEKYGTGGNWIALPQKAGLKRCGKSCRLRWLNYLRPDIKHGGFTEEEDQIILTLYNTIGSRWSVIASHLPGRTDNDVKNYWNTKLKKKLMAATTNTTAAATQTVPLNFNPTNYYGIDSISVGSQPALLPSLMEVQENCTAANVITSYNQEAPFSYDFGSSWFGNGGIEEDVFGMDMSSSAALSSSSSSSTSPSCFDHILNYGFDFERFAAPNMIPNCSHQPSKDFGY